MRPKMDSITFFRSLLTHYLPETVSKKPNSGYLRSPISTSGSPRDKQPVKDGGIKPS